METTFAGVIPATITPFTSAGELNETAFRRLLQWNIDAGVDGFWVSGGTGESVLLTEEEVVRSAEIAAEVCRGRAKSIVHVGALTTRSAVRMARAARDAGVDAVSCVPPFFYAPTDQMIIDHYLAVADAAALPFFIYNQPLYTGVEFTAPLMEKIVKVLPQIVGVKHSAADFENIARFTELGLVVLVGHGTLLVSALAAGAVGVVDGPLTVAPEIWVAMYRAYQTGDMARAQQLQRDANRVMALVGSFGFHASCKALAGARLGIECGHPRLPLPSLSPDRQRELISAAASLGLTFSLPPSVTVASPA